jgi:hypothetical protein
LSSSSATSLQEAQKLQFLISKADFIMAKAGISGTKGVLQSLYGYGGSPRKPLPSYRGDVAKLIEEIKQLLDFENGLK